ncbi:hypothetical protein [Niabella aurantiaca]|uniref:hypothetical protein n=1 Tax=Niabella aurantiaca TaxID=379900 RepID=UPI00036E2FF0|nr:hypothetical protein [Niabella aurantiaca]
MPFFRLPDSRIVDVQIKFDPHSDSFAVSYEGRSAVMEHDPNLDLYLRVSGDLLPDEIVVQVNEYIKNDKVDYTLYGHFIVPLEDENNRYYASCNFHYFEDYDGIAPDGSVDVYLLHPKKGSIVTRLELDAENEMYNVAEGMPALDSLEIDAISQAIKEYNAKIKG